MSNGESKPYRPRFAIGDIIAEAMEKVKKDGVITIENVKGIDSTVKVVE